MEADGATRLFFHNACKKILKVARKTIINTLLFSWSANRSCRDKLCQESPMTCVRFLQLSAKYANINAVPNSLWTWYLSSTAKCHICVGQIHRDKLGLALSSLLFSLATDQRRTAKKGWHFAQDASSVPFQNTATSTRFPAPTCPLPSHTLASCEP